MYGGTLLDFVTTRVALSKGFAELNPIMGQGWKRQLILLFGSSGAGHVMSLFMPEYPAMAFIITIGVVHGVVGVMNIGTVIKG